MTLFIFKARKSKTMKLIKTTSQASKTGVFFVKIRSFTAISSQQEFSSGGCFQQVHLAELKAKLIET